MIEFISPSLRTGLADFPHPALQLMVLPTRGLTGQTMCGDQRVQPQFGKERVGPAMMIRTPPTPASPASLAQDASQTHPYPAIQSNKRGLQTVFEIPKPAS